ncbi:hypothetical protein [Amycolatopsis sp. FDAARGOS 1241]|uniref:hypothetical protein n=1 Tax=Amycolatopsis sp. FDAARGOS 1241 TaxID=2778070 RepID=UPI00195294AB|nr:hypothetical protein [Amycolatopsis sp. FDAARGOS 1241]QRP42748.1 hypothetical protein I6J71_25025 [Amycolatopsis sp. FDAARGOS 1241]
MWSVLTKQLHTHRCLAAAGSTTVLAAGLSPLWLDGEARVRRGSGLAPSAQCCAEKGDREPEQARARRRHDRVLLLGGDVPADERDRIRAPEDVRITSYSALHVFSPRVEGFVHQNGGTVTGSIASDDLGPHSGAAGAALDKAPLSRFGPTIPSKSADRGGTKPKVPSARDEGAEGINFSRRSGATAGEPCVVAGGVAALGQLTERIQVERPVVEPPRPPVCSPTSAPTGAPRCGRPAPPLRPVPSTCPASRSATMPPALPGMTTFELASADLWATGITADRHPIEFLRAHLDHLGALPAGQLLDVADGTRIKVGGAATHKQRPATAGDITFLNLEDETGIGQRDRLDRALPLAPPGVADQPGAARARHRSGRAGHGVAGG